VSIGYAITGSHCTGKSTLVNAIKSKLDISVFTIQEIARGVINRGFPLGKEATLDAYANLIADQLEIENLGFSSNREVLISDRTLLDTLSYAEVNQTLGRGVPAYVINLLKQICLLEAQRFELYVYLPIEFPNVSDGIRDEDEKYRELVSLCILNNLKLLQIPYVSLSGSKEERLHKMLRLINSR